MFYRWVNQCLVKRPLQNSLNPSRGSPQTDYAADTSILKVEATAKTNRAEHPNCHLSEGVKNLALGRPPKSGHLSCRVCTLPDDSERMKLLFFFN